MEAILCQSMFVLTLALSDEEYERVAGEKTIFANACEGKEAMSMDQNSTYVICLAVDWLPSAMGARASRIRGTDK
jgi:hypothetical protein